ncbi:MAG: RimK family alpha-L-glutamate ligase [Nitrosomonadales bacterium]|nr:RimK family alpha-L-glutamate ligase [Nitrosomonadales bacterium]
MNPADERDTLIGLATLMRQAYAGGDLTPLGTELLAIAGEAPDATCANALLDLSLLLQIKGSPEVALNMQAEALRLRRLYHLPVQEPVELRVLALMGPGDIMANTPLEFLVEDSHIALDLLYLLPGEPFPAMAPDHDVLFVAACESDANQPLLTQLADYLRFWPRPVLNQPAQIATLSRDGSYVLLKDAPGIAIPPTQRATRAELEALSRAGSALATLLPGADFPIIVRPVGSHAGKGLDKIGSPAELAAYLQGMAQSDFFISPFVDYRSADGLYRKYRLVLIGGRAYGAHMGISEHWMIHYVNAGMADSAEKRAEEAAFFADFDQHFAPRHQRAIAELNARFKLDYLVIDCAETPSGELLIFELDSGAVVHSLDPADLYPYKVPQMRKVFDSFYGLISSASKHQPD